MKPISISLKEKNDCLQYIVKWQNDNGEEMQTKSMEFPRPELIETLEAFSEFILIMCMQDPKKVSRLYIAGATFVYRDKEPWLSLGVEMHLQNGYSFDFKSPLRRLDVENPDLEQSTNWEDRYTKLAIKLGEEILLYAQGKRAQTTLDLEGNEDG